MDEVDGAILRELIADSRISMADLGRRVGLAPSTVHKRIARLLESGVIERFTISLDPEIFARHTVAFLTIRVTDDAKGSAERFLKDCAGVLDVYESLEPGEYVVRVKVPSIGALKRDILIPLSGLEGVEEVSPLLTIRAVKESFQPRLNGD